MSRFWPEGLSVSDVQSPYEILESAREEWEAESEGILTLELQLSDADEGNATITVSAKHVPSNRTSTLFAVIHRLNEPYPAVIKPYCKTLPNILKKSYVQPGMNVEKNESYEYEFLTHEGTVTNKRVSDTPAEFREKLTASFNLSEVKAAVLSLTSRREPLNDDNNAGQE
ncbi:MAG: hypothetical protein D3904_11835 [Candidatus Electrothrix sp. EH2]|nr:hypothetical protein [Candidatus Electrothrix sp. EH2]